MKRKNLFLCLILFLSLFLFSLTSCNKDDNKDTNDNTSDTTNNDSGNNGSEDQITKFTVTFKGDEGTVLSTQKVNENEKVVEPQVPTKDSSAQYDYVFDGWYNGEDKWSFDTVVTKNLELTAKFTGNVRAYLVKFVDEDGTVLKEETLEYGQIPVAPTAPIKDATVEYKYEFSGWDKNIAAVSGETVYTATYLQTKQVYTITFMLEDGTVLEQVDVEYGAIPTCSVAPEKVGDETVKYVFKCWNNEVVAVTQEATYIATFETYLIGKGNVETFDANIYLETEKQISGCYNYFSRDKADEENFPLLISNGKLEMLVLSDEKFGAVSIDFGKVVSGKNYLISLDIDMQKADGSPCLDGFAYAFGSIQGSTTASAGGIITNFAELKTIGQFQYMFTATEDLDNLYLIIRSQMTKHYLDSKVIIDNVLCKETAIKIATTNNIASGILLDNFAEGLIAADPNNSKITRYYGAMNAFTPNLNSTLEFIEGENPVLRLKHTVSTQNGLYAFKIDGIVAGKTYEVTMNLDMFDANGNNVNSSANTYFQFMIYANNDFASNRYKIYDVNNDDLGITPLVQSCFVQENICKFTFVANEDGYVNLTIRSQKNLGSIYADLSNLSIRLVEIA